MPRRSPRRRAPGSPLSLFAQRSSSPSPRAQMPQSLCDALERRDLVINPSVGLLEPVVEAGAGLPVQPLADHRVITVASPHALRGEDVVAANQADSGDLLDDVDELVDRDHLAGAKVDRLVDVAGHDLQRALDAVVDVHEAPGLPSIPPDLDLAVSGRHRLCHLAADCRRSLLAAAGPRALRTVDVVV